MTDDPKREPFPHPWAMTPEQLGRCLQADRITPKAAKELIDEWRRLYPGITRWWEKFKDEGGRS